MIEIFQILLTESFWAASLRIATPLIFGVLGALICEKSGVLNLGIEGIFVAGAMAGWMAVWLGAGLWGGVVVAAIAGGFFGLIHAILTVTFRFISARIRAWGYLVCNVRELLFLQDCITKSLFSSKN